MDRLLNSGQGKQFFSGKRGGLARHRRVLILAIGVVSQVSGHESICGDDEISFWLVVFWEFAEVVVSAQRVIILSFPLWLRAYDCPCFLESCLELVIVDGDWSEVFFSFEVDAAEGTINFMIPGVGAFCLNLRSLSVFDVDESLYEVLVLFLNTFFLHQGPGPEAVRTPPLRRRTVNCRFDVLQLLVVPRLILEVKKTLRTQHRHLSPTSFYY